MTDSLFTRIGRLVSGSVHQLVAAAENSAPEAVMGEAIREVDTAIDEVRVEIGREQAAKHNATMRLAQENERHESLNEQIRVALEQSRNDLAEAGVAMQLDIEAQIPVLERAIADAGDREKELGGFLAALQARRREMLDEVERVKQAQEQSAGTGSASVTSDSEHGAINRRVDAANSVFDRVAAAATGTPNATASSDPAKLAELEALERRNRIQERLAQLRANS